MLSLITDYFQIYSDNYVVHSQLLCLERYTYGLKEMTEHTIRIIKRGGADGTKYPVNQKEITFGT